MYPENISDVSDQFMDKINSLTGQDRHEKIEEIKNNNHEILQIITGGALTP